MSQERTSWVAAATLTMLLVAMGAVAQRRNFDRRSVSGQPPIAKNAAEGRILEVLDRMGTSGGTYLAVAADDGRMLRLLAESTNAKQVAEIGTSTGYSGLWLSLALTNTGGRLTTFELDAGRAAQARSNFQQAGVDHLITVVEGDAHKNVKSLRAPLDLVFLDADKEGYADYLAVLLPLVRPGGLVVADNVEMAPDYIAAVTRSRDLDTVFNGRMSITLKKR
jgi:predicted O-methyltransferase YrrM